MLTSNLTTSLNGRTRTRVPILLYHMVSDNPARGLEHYCVSPDAFRRQMAWLSDKGYTSMSFGELVDHYLDGVPLPLNPVMITLDDGFEDNFYGAYPVLEGLGLQATIFLVAGLVGQAAFWNSSYGPPAKLLSWEEVSAMAQGPITFGAHTITHPHLCGLSPVRAREEIAGAKTILEDRMGREVSFFSYPFSDFSPMLRDYVAEAGYQAACSSILGYSDGSDDIYALRRVIVGGGDSLEAFAKKVRGRSTGRETLRTALRKVKRAVLQMRLRCNSGERNVAGCLLDKRRKDSAQGLISASKGGLPCRRRDTWT